MKKVSKIIVLCLLITLTLSTIILINNKKETKIQENIQESNKIISMMFQDEKGHYVESKDTSWPKEGYRFNKNKSKCLNGSKIKYEENNIVVQTTKADKCYAYFDNNNFVEDLSGNGNHGLNVNAHWSKDGLITGDANGFYGYINCGLENFDFKNKITFILKFRYNKESIDLISNHQASGAGLKVVNSGLSFMINISELNAYQSVKTNSNLLKVGEEYIGIGTYDGFTIAVYLNGEKNEMTSIIGNVKPSDEPILVGGNPTNHGQIDSVNNSYITIKEVLVFNRTLFETEINTDYVSTINPTNKDGLLLWYKFD